MIGRIDIVSRGAFGVLCIAAMALEAIPVLMIVGVVGGVGLALDGHETRAVGVWLGSWGAAAVSTLLFLAMAYLFWPLASDWIIEWPGYVTGLIIGAVGLAFMALVVFVTDWPLAIELIIPFLITFLVGFIIPGWFLGLGGSAIRTLPHERVTRRR